MIGKLEVLRKAVRESPRQETELLVVFHLLPDTEQFIDTVVEVFEIERIIGVPYSSRPATARNLRQKYDIEVTIPETIDAVEEEAKSYVEEFNAREHDRELLILDVGGHCASFINDVETDAIRGIVEDTNQGHWRYETVDLPVPVFSIAQAKLKQLENRTVGEAIVFSLENIIRNEFEQELNGKRVLVLGYGNIGQSVAKACRGRGAEVMIHDIDAVKNISAKLEGYSVGDRESMFRNAQIVIGASGHRSITQDDFESFEDNTIILSGSSKQVEIDIEGLQEEGTPVERTEIATTYELNGRMITLLNDGCPVNFLDNSVSLAILDLVYPALFSGMMALCNGTTEPEIHEPDDEIVQDIATTWLEVY